MRRADITRMYMPARQVRVKKKRGWNRSSVVQTQPCSPMVSWTWLQGQEEAVTMLQSQKRPQTHYNCARIG